MKKLPPIEKIYEAYSAIADDRVTIHSHQTGGNRAVGQREQPQQAEHVGQASVLSSNRAKAYTVAWSGKKYTSNDNATYWQGYAGYPVIAVLMLQSILPLNKEMAAQFAGINWTKANAAAKRDYVRAVETVFAQLPCDEERKSEIRAEVARVYEVLQTLDIEVGRFRAG